MVRTHFVVQSQPLAIQKRIKKWARKREYKVLRYQNGYIKIEVGRGYSRAMVIIYIMTFWIGAIIHRMVRKDYGKIYIFITPYGPATLLTLNWQGAKCADAIVDLKKEIKARLFRPSQFH